MKLRAQMKSLFNNSDYNLISNLIVILLSFIIHLFAAIEPILTHLLDRMLNFLCSSLTPSYN
jgi:hypothetical protein